MSTCILPLLVALIAIGVGASPLAGQDDPDRGVSLGVGLGISQVRAADLRGVGPHLSGKLGVPISGPLAGVLQLGVFGPGNETPQVGDVVVGEDGVSTVVVRRRKLLRTPVLLLGIQLGAGPGPYVRGSVGLGSHSFAEYGPWPSMSSASKSSAIGPAAGAAAGYAVRFRGSARLEVEAVVIRSGGEDSSSPRTIFGLNIMPVLLLR